ncbi:uncharacterized protein BDZ99DRAFT_469585 [Mytilinidion resinicola]|uniref:F-box domain-containing protein n=1 Tax=Mytilinidion resinicola TaxID=574789 RepID=A0A6A6XYL8_9PEZI|nr:uncharacterized protein BDZ99DRAFT_469585 [Mytilinidion resinicola]KAF2801592.1 hypothetical protein BDZ99DRAFT_469585 [Mytilinidion resinicola]
MSNIIYPDLIVSLEQQLRRHEIAALRLHGEPVPEALALELDRWMAEEKGSAEQEATSPVTVAHTTLGEDCPARDQVLNTFELVGNIISMLPTEEILQARLVSKDWLAEVEALLRNTAFREKFSTRIVLRAYSLWARRARHACRKGICESIL